LVCSCRHHAVCFLYAGFVPADPAYRKYLKASTITEFFGRSACLRSEADGEFHHRLAEPNSVAVVRSAATGAMGASGMTPGQMLL